jgi:hypothetical protein
MIGNSVSPIIGEAVLAAIYDHLLSSDDNTSDGEYNKKRETALADG